MQGSYASFEDNVYLKDAESVECLWILELKHSSLDIQLEHYLTGKKLALSSTRITHGIWTVRGAGT